MSALVLQAGARGWWDRFRRGHALPAPEAAPLWERWGRARDLGVPDEAVEAEVGLLRGEALRERQARLDPFWSEVEGLFAHTAAAASEHHFKVLLADADGVVVRAAGGGGFAPVARQLRLMEGAAWGEAVRGTNAIGTALTEGRVTAVVGGAHYTRAFQDLVCYAAPIRDLEGNVVAVLDASSLVARTDPAVGALVAAAALAMEAGWKARAWAAAGAEAVGLLERTLDRVACPALVVSPAGQIVRCNPPARVAIGAPGEVYTALGVAWPALKAAALGAGSVAFAVPRFGRLPAGHARLEALRGAQGVLVGVAVFYDPPAPSRRAALSGAARPAARLPELGASPSPDAFAAVYADDPTTRAAVDLGRRVAPSDLPIVLLAETGSGKERFAEALHAASRRASGPFVAVNCGSFAPELLAAELFGHGPGAFTGADRAGREGLLHAASHGTLFLDEVGEMPPAMQVALLRVLEDGRYERVGERVPRRADVRVICATCRDLPALVEAGAFRRDLWYRLKGVVLRLPALRDRQDRLGLARFLLRGAAAPHPPPEIGDELARFIERYPWPGNVRELKSVLEVACVLADGEPVLGVEHLPPDLAAAEAAGPAATEVPEDGALDAVQVWAIRRALDACRGNVSAAARRLGVARSTIYRVLQRGR